MVNSTRLVAVCSCAILALFTGCTRDKSGESAAPGLGTMVVNLAHDNYDEYIGRGIEVYAHMLAAGIKPGDEGWLGNPHPIGWCDRCLEDHSRAECIAAFQRDFHHKIETDPAFREQVLTLRGKRLGCYCKPEACHGDIIKAWIDSVSQISDS